MQPSTSTLPTSVAPKRYSAATIHPLPPGGGKPHKSTRREAHNPRRTLTEPEKESAKQKRAAKREAYEDVVRNFHDQTLAFAEQLKAIDGSHATEYYVQDLLERPANGWNTRGVNTWNAYIRLRLGQMNEGASCWHHDSVFYMQTSLTERGFRAEQLKVGDKDAMAIIQKEWDEFSNAQKVEITKDTVLEMAKEQEVRQTVKKQVPQAVHGDMTKTIDQVQEEVR